MVVELSSKKKKCMWTFDQLQAEMAETNQPVEIWDGELSMTPSPSPLHQETVARLARLLSDFVSGRQLGWVYFTPLDVVLTRRRVVQPDIIYIWK